MKKIIKKLQMQGSKENAYTLLEYCAGAAIIAGILWVALDTLGGSMGQLMTDLGAWLGERSTDLADRN